VARSAESGADQPDDITLLVVSFTGAPAREQANPQTGKRRSLAVQRVAG
jgi:hypothetical protein